MNFSGMNKFYTRGDKMNSVSYEIMDLLLVNANIITMDEKGSIHQSIGIKDGKIKFIGSNEQALAIEAVEKLDADGLTVLPGFIDTHLHLVDYALFENFIKLYSYTDKEQLIEAGKNFIESDSLKFGWVLGRGWDQNKFTDKKTFPTRYDLDLISEDIPVLYTRVCGHIASVNSVGLEMILQLEEAVHLADYIDKENGILRESAAYLYMKLLKELELEEIKSLIVQGHKNLNRAGITSVHSVDFMALPGNNWENIIKAYKELDEEKRITVRTYEQCMFNSLDSYDDFLQKGYAKDDGTDHFKIGPLKLLADGSLGARTALLSDPYTDDESTCGYQVFDEIILGQFFEKAVQNDMQIAVHGIGDRSIEISADMLSKLIDGKNTLRHGIIHAQITNQRILDKIKKSDLILYIQPVFVDTDMDIAEQRIGKDRMDKIYAWKTMFDMGIKACGGSDAPVVGFDIMENIYFAVTRKNICGLPEGGWMPQEKLSVYEALRLFTANAAYASFEEDFKGSLKIGKAADMAIIDRDILKTDPDLIKDIKVVYTIIDGKIVFEDR